MATIPFYEIHDNMSRVWMVELEGIPKTEDKEEKEKVRKEIGPEDTEMDKARKSEGTGIAHLYLEMMTEDYDCKGYKHCFSVRYRHAFIGYDPSPEFDANEVYGIGNSILLELPEVVPFTAIAEAHCEDDLKLKLERELKYKTREKKEKTRNEQKRRHKQKTRNKIKTQKQAQKKEQEMFARIEKKREFLARKAGTQATRTYMYIGSHIDIFSTDEEIVHYVSPVGNNDVPYPYAIGLNSIFLMSEEVEISIRDFPLDEIDDPYWYYYGHWTRDGEKASTAKAKFYAYPTALVVEDEW